MSFFSILFLVFAGANAFSQPRYPSTMVRYENAEVVNPPPALSSRRDFLAALTTTSSAVALLFPAAASAGIDVSGLRTNGGGGNSIQDQLKAYDGSGSRRIEEIRAVSSSSSSSTTPRVTAFSSSTPAAPAGVATWALRATEPTYRKVNLGIINRYEGQLVSPQGPMARGIPVSFEYPSDWLQLDRANGCVQYVDQRNGDKLYLLRVTLPASSDDGTAPPSLASVPKSFFASAIFSPEGSLVQSGGLTVEDARASSDKLLSSECPANSCAPHRRLKLKFATVTGNGLRVERRGLVDAYQVGQHDVYMLMTSSNAVKFEKGGIERDTVEAIVDSFRIEV